MTDLKIEAGKCYKTRDGRKAWVVEIDAASSCGLPVMGFVDGSPGPLTWFPGGMFSCAANEVSDVDLISEWKEPRKGEVWTNLYKDSGGTITARGYASKSIADDAAQYDKGKCGYRFACVGPIPWTEGQGLDGEGE